MTDKNNVSVVGNDTVVKGEIRNCRQIEIYGYVEGDVLAGAVIVHEGGRFFGRVKAENAQINGTFQGEMSVGNLVSIGSSGSVTGNIRYGRLAMELGGNLSAELRNIPPEIAGDFSVMVNRGRSVGITTSDLTAFDPDDAAEHLTYTVSNANNGFVMLSGAPATPVTRFTQSDLQSGLVNFKHSGADTKMASFDVVVADAEGATSGAARTVTVAVRS